MTGSLDSNNLMGYLLTDFIYTFPEIAHFKESKNFTYQFSNRSNLGVYNLTNEQDIIGKTVFDLNNTVMNGKWPPGFASEIHQSDLSVVTSKKPLKLDHKIFLNQAGFLVIHSMIKMPVFNSGHEVFGILTLSFDSTKMTDIFRVKKLYANFYSNKESNVRFMMHLGFHEGVKLGLSSREIDCLLGIAKCRTYKATSRFLNISTKTIDNHLNRIKEKQEVIIL